jgi:hypothetical protein
MLAKFRREKASPDFIYAFEKTGNFVTSENRDDWSAKELKEWDRLLPEYHRRTALEGWVIDLCFRLHHESGRSAIGRQRRFAASEFGIAVLSAHEQGPEQRLPVSTSAAFEKLIAKIEAARTTDGSWFGKLPAPGEEGERENAVVIDEIHHAILHCEQEGVPEDVIESMLLRSWIRMLVFNEHEDERVFHILDKYWEQVHATFQIRMAGYSGLRVQ